MSYYFPIGAIPKGALQPTTIAEPVSDDLGPRSCPSGQSLAVLGENGIWRSKKVNEDLRGKRTKCITPRTGKSLVEQIRDQCGYTGDQVAGRPENWPECFGYQLGQRVTRRSAAEQIAIQEGSLGRDVGACGDLCTRIMDAWEKGSEARRAVQETPGTDICKIYDNRPGGAEALCRAVGVPEEYVAECAAMHRAGTPICDIPALVAAAEAQKKKGRNKMLLVGGLAVVGVLIARKVLK